MRVSRVADRVWPESIAGGRLRKESAVIILELGIRSRLRRRERERVARRIIAVDLEFLNRLAPRLIRLRAAVGIENTGCRAA